MENNKNRWYAVDAILKKLELSELSDEYTCIKNLKAFKEKVLNADDEYSEILDKHDIAGPILDDYLMQDDFTCQVMGQTYLDMMIKLIDKKRLDDTLELYIHMVNFLFCKYSIDVDYIYNGNIKK